MSFSKQDTCKYIRDTSAQLAALSTDAGLDVLAYTLSMAQLEAENLLAEMHCAPLLQPEASGHIGNGAEAKEMLVAFAP